MAYQITSTNFHISPNLSALVNEKIKKIERHLASVNDEVVELRVVVNKAPGFGYLVKLELWIPKATLVAKAGGVMLEGVIEEAVEEMIRQIDRHKGRRFAKNKKFLRRLKEFLFYSRYFDQL